MKAVAKLQRPRHKESVSDFIRRLIGDAGFNQSDFAERVGLTRQSVNSIVNGATDISPATAHKLQAELNCDGEYLLVLQAKAAFKAAAPKLPVAKSPKAKTKATAKEPLVSPSVVQKIRDLAKRESRPREGTRPSRREVRNS